MPSHLLHLAPELLALIADQLEDDLETLRALALTSRKLQDVAEKVLYRTIFLQTSQQCTKLSQNLELRSTRVTSLLSLDARCVDRGDEMSHYLPLLSDIFKKASNLRTLTIESPVCNYGSWLHSELWPELVPTLFAPLAQSAIAASDCIDIDRPLQRLRQLTLHWNGDKSRYWTIENDFGKLFALPTVEELTLSCCTFPPDALAMVRDLPQTPLKRLDLVECNISPSALRDMLSRPKALEQLRLGENRCHRFDTKPSKMYNSLCARDLVQFLSALRQQERSLEQFYYQPETDTHYADSSSSHILSSCVGFTSFEKLTNLHLDGICPSLELILNRMPPPNLVSMRFEGYHVAVEGLPDMALPGGTSEVAYKDSNHLHRMCRRLSSIKSLKQVAVVMPQYDISWDVHFRVIEAAVREFNLKKTHVMLWRPPTYHSGVIPPYLYGESAPVLSSIYDSQGDGWIEDD